MSLTPRQLPGGDIPPPDSIMPVGLSGYVGWSKKPLCRQAIRLGRHRRADGTLTAIVLQGHPKPRLIFAAAQVMSRIDARRCQLVNRWFGYLRGEVPAECPGPASTRVFSF